MKAGYNIGIIRTNNSNKVVVDTEYRMMEEFMEHFNIDNSQDVISNIQELHEAKVSFKLIATALVGFLHGTYSTKFNTTKFHDVTSVELDGDLLGISLREFVYNWEQGDLTELKNKLCLMEEKLGYTDDPLKDKSDKYLMDMNNAVADANEVAEIGTTDDDDVYINGKALSDVYTSTDGKFCIEWEFENGGRYRESFESESERDKKLEPYRTGTTEKMIDGTKLFDELASLGGTDDKIVHNHIVRHTIQKTDDIKAFMYAGNSTFTIQNTETMNRFTYKLSKPKTDMNGNKADKDVKVWFVKVMTGTDNNSDYSFVGTVFENNNGVKFYKHSTKSKITSLAQSVKVINWFVDRVEKNSVPKQIEFYHEGRCVRCGRKLTVPESIENGIGPECIKMM